MTFKLGKYNLIDKYGQGMIKILTPSLNPNLDNCGPWKQGQKSPIYNIKELKIMLNKPRK